MTNTVIVTGASGFVGQHVMRRLAQRRIKALTVGFRDVDVENLRAVEAHGAQGESYPLAAITNFSLVHLAWCSPVRNTFAPHVRQVRLLSEFVELFGGACSRVIALGSAEEYGSAEGRLNENVSVKSNLSSYGWGKLAAQTLVESWCALHSKPGLWLRPFTVYGEGQAGDMAIPYAVRQARRNERAEFSAGTQLRDFVHVDDVARAICLAIESSFEGFNVVNLGTGVGTPLRTALELVATRLGATEPFSFGSRRMRPGEPAVQIAATETAVKLLGFTAQINLDQGIQRMKTAFTTDHASK